MKRPAVPLSEPVIALEEKALWDFALSVGISQELKAVLPAEDWNNPPAVRLAICQHFPEFIATLEAVEGTYLAATEFVNACLTTVLRQAPIFNPYTPRPGGEVIAKKTATKKKKEDTILRDKEGRSALIERCSSRRDVLGKVDYSPKWLSDYKVIGQPLTACDVPNIFSTYNTIYYCLTEWGMDTLLDLLHSEGFLAFGIRNDTVKSEECMRFKVITNEPFLQ